MESQSDVHRLLGYTPANFVKLSARERTAIYRQHLVTRNVVLIDEGDDEDFYNPELAQGILLRQEYAVGEDEAGKQIAKEAREIYYKENTFMVPSHWLAEFIWDTLADGTPLRVDCLIRKIIVRVDVVNAWAEDDEDLVTDGEDESTWGLSSLPRAEQRRKEDERKKLPRMPRTARELQRLLPFAQVERLDIQICGRGALDGSEAPTQKKIHEIAGVVQQLILQFPQQLAILRVVHDLGTSSARDLRPYWDPPRADAQERVRNGRPSFTELMQTRIAEWTRGVGGEIGPPLVDA